MAQKFTWFRLLFSGDSLVGSCWISLRPPKNMIDIPHRFRTNVDFPTLESINNHRVSRLGTISYYIPPLPQWKNPDYIILYQQIPPLPQWINMNKPSYLEVPAACTARAAVSPSSVPWSLRRPCLGIFRWKRLWRLWLLISLAVYHPKESPNWVVFGACWDMLKVFTGIPNLHIIGNNGLAWVQHSWTHTPWSRYVKNHSGETCSKLLDSENADL